MTGKALAVRGEAIAMRNSAIKRQLRVAPTQHTRELIAVRDVHGTRCDGTNVHTSTSAFVSQNPHNRLAPSFKNTSHDGAHHRG
jgi:hypothetical protein